MVGNLTTHMETLLNQATAFIAIILESPPAAREIIVIIVQLLSVKKLFFPLESSYRAALIPIKPTFE